MKKILTIIVAFTLGMFVNTVQAQSQTKTKEVKGKTVEASCAQCQFKVKEPRGCDLAIRMNGQVYFVDGTNLDAHGDAHEEDGFCNAIRQAKITGQIQGNRIRVTQFDLKPLAKKSN